MFHPQTAGVSDFRYRAKSAQIRQPRPESGLGSQVEVLKTFEVVPSSLGSGRVLEKSALAPATTEERHDSFRFLDLGLKVRFKRLDAIKVMTGSRA